jgi:hypothetical protein
LIRPLAGNDAVRIAMLCHEANRAFCEYLGDNSQVPWAEASVEIQASAINGVRYHNNYPDAGDAGSHDNWLRFKENEGYVYGEVKCATAKTHPCMVPFDQLPPEQQFKDKLFRTLVHAALEGRKLI